MGESRVVPFILDKGRKKIDLLILSHLDEDHFGGLESITEMLDVDIIMIGDAQHEEEKYNELVEANKQLITENEQLKLELAENMHNLKVWQQEIGITPEFDIMKQSFYLLHFLRKVLEIHH